MGGRTGGGCLIPVDDTWDGADKIYCLVCYLFPFSAYLFHLYIFKYVYTCMPAFFLRYLNLYLCLLLMHISVISFHLVMFYDIFSCFSLSFKKCFWGVFRRGYYFT